MDMVFHRYASPMVIMDKMILTGRFNEFVNEFVKIRNEELDDKWKWEYWLYRVFDMPFDKFLEKISESEAEIITEDAAKDAVKESWGILQGFVPT